MKAGYGKLPIRTLSRHQEKDYVEVYLDDIDNDKYVKMTDIRFKRFDFKDFSKYFNVLKLENTKVIDLANGVIENDFGTTVKDNLSSGMKCLLVALKYANEKKDI